MKFVNSGLSYTAAESACAAYGGLVKINTADKQSAIENFLLDNTNGEYMFKTLHCKVQVHM